MAQLDVYGNPIDSFSTSNFGLSNNSSMQGIGGNTSSLGMSIDPSLSTNGTDIGGLMGDFGKLTGGISSLAQIGLGFKALGIAEDELDIKKDQWKLSKEELRHMQATRKRITAQYNGASTKPGSGSAQLAKTDVSAF